MQSINITAIPCSIVGEVVEDEKGPADAYFVERSGDSVILPVAAGCPRVAIV